MWLVSSLYVIGVRLDTQSVYLKFVVAPAHLGGCCKCPFAIVRRATRLVVRHGRGHGHHVAVTDRIWNSGGMRARDAWTRVVWTSCCSNESARELLWTCGPEMCGCTPITIMCKSPKQRCRLVRWTSPIVWLRRWWKVKLNYMIYKVYLYLSMLWRERVTGRGRGGYTYLMGLKYRQNSDKTPVKFRSLENNSLIM